MQVGATVHEGHDYIEITPPTKLNHAAIDTYNDHRLVRLTRATQHTTTPLSGVSLHSHDIPRKRTDNQSRLCPHAASRHSI